MLFIPPALPPPPPAMAACIPSLMERGDARPASIGSIVSDERPIRVHWTEQGHEGRAAIVLEAAELAWQVQVDELGFAAPVLPDGADGPELDIYLADLAPWEGWAWAPDQTDHVPGDGHMGAPAYVAIDRDLPQEWLASYTTHEFNHVLQYATDFNEPSLNVWEATAVAAQHWTLGLVEGSWDLDVPDFQASPWAPTLLGDGYVLQDDWGVADSFFEYGAALWVMALDVALGDGDGSIGPALWEALAGEGPDNEPDVLDGVAALAGGSLADALDAIALRRWDGADLPGAADWDGSYRPALLAELTADELPMALLPEVAVTGQAFVTITGLAADLHLNTGVVSESGLGSSVIDWQDGDRRVVALSNLGPDGFDPDVDEAWVLGDQVLQLYLDDQPIPEPDGTGCSCETGGGPSRRAPGLALALLLLTGLARRGARRSRSIPHRGAAGVEPSVTVSFRSGTTG
jgi:hypothetical protein